jgi:hypothetical protein
MFRLDSGVTGDAVKTCDSAKKSVPLAPNAGETSEVKSQRGNAQGMGDLFTGDLLEFGRYGGAQKGASAA